jgi:hypothetical protein
VKITAQVWKDTAIGWLIGLFIEAHGSTFKGRLAEAEFFVSYISSGLGAAVVYVCLARWIHNRRQKRQPTYVAPPASSGFFYAAVVVLCLMIACQLVADFPNGDGLFHESHAQLVSFANRDCLARRSDTAFCSCWAEKLATAAERQSPVPEPVARGILAACSRD